MVNATEQQAEKAIAMLKRAIDAAENSNQAGENAVVLFASAPKLLAAAERALGQLGDHGGCSCMSEGPDCCAFSALQTAIAIARAELVEQVKA